MATNELGALGAQFTAVSDDPPNKYRGTTLGAYRRGRSVSWCPGAEIDVWTACARPLAALGFTGEDPVTWPHAYFIQTIGGDDGDGGQIMCHGCRAELRLLRALLGPGRALVREEKPEPKQKKPTNQMSLF